MPLLYEKLISLLQSRRFYATVSSILVALLHDQLGIDQETATAVVAALLSWVLGDSLRASSR